MHLHRQIDEHRCDVTHVTEHKGSPQTLVCTKTQASYERWLKQYELEKKQLAELEAIASVERNPAGRTVVKSRRPKR